MRVLTTVDTFSRFSPALEPRFTFRGADVVEVLVRVRRQVRFPATIRVDQGMEFVSRDIDPWAYQRDVTLDSLTARQADGQRVRQSVQWSPPRGMSERPLVPRPCSCSKTNGGLAQVLQ